MDGAMGFLAPYIGYVRAALAVWLLARCARSMLQARHDPEVWGFVELPGGKA